MSLERFYNIDNKYELSLDEVGRGCLLGRVYIACVVLPKEPIKFDGKDIKDSKKIKSRKKMHQIAEYIKQNSVAWDISYIDADIIDNINILKSVMQGMHKSINSVINQINKNNENSVMTDTMVIVDGNYFTPYMYYNNEKQSLCELNSVTVIQGDAKYMGIAAASILAKDARDTYIENLCDEYPILDEYYGLKKNKGYGTKQHIEGIKEYGITKYHRKTYGNICKNAYLNNCL